MKSQDLSILRIRHDLDKALGVSQRHRLPASLEREATYFDLPAHLLGLLLGQTDAGYLGRAVSAIRDL